MCGMIMDAEGGKKKRTDTQKLVARELAKKFLAFFGKTNVTDDEAMRFYDLLEELDSAKHFVKYG